MATDDELLQQIKKLLEAEREQTRKLIREEIQASEKRVKEELKQAILDAQKDTIETLSDLIHTGYNMHEKRIKKIEDHVGLPHTV